MPNLDSCFEYTQADSTSTNQNWLSSFSWARTSCINMLNAVPNFVRELTSIKINIGQTGNYGCQAADINFLSWLRREGFRGLAHIVYQNWGDNKEKIFRLLNIPFRNQSDYYEAAQNIRIVDQEQFTQASPITLGACGDPTSEGVAACISYNPYTGPHDANNNKVFFQACDSTTTHAVTQTLSGTTNLPVVTPPLATVLQEKSIQEFLKDTSGIQAFINLVKNKLATIMPIYGWTTSLYSNNLLNIILGGRYAQQHSAELQNRPLVLTTFYELAEDKITELLDVINGKKVEINNFPVPDELRAAIQRAQLENNFEVIRATDTHINELLANLKTGKIYLLVLRSMPKILFDSLFTDPAMLVPVREGASSYSTLIPTGRPHLQCATDMDDPEQARFLSRIDWSAAPPALRTRVLELEAVICHGDVEVWRTHELDKMLGEYIQDANNSNSELVAYFKYLQTLAADPRNDRYRLLMLQVIDLLKKQHKSNSDKPCLNVDLNKQEEPVQVEPEPKALDSALKTARDDSGDPKSEPAHEQPTPSSSSEIPETHEDWLSYLEKKFPNAPAAFRNAFYKSLLMGTTLSFVTHLAEPMLKKQGVSKTKIMATKLAMVSLLFLLGGKWMASGGSFITSMICLRLGASQTVSAFLAMTVGCGISAAQSLTPVGAAREIGFGVGGFVGGLVGKGGAYLTQAIFPRFFKPKPAVNEVRGEKVQLRLKVS